MGTRERKKVPGWVNPQRHPPTTGNTLVRELFSEIRRQGISLYKLANDTLYNHNNFHLWASGKGGMKLQSFIDIANYLGYDVVLVRRTTKDPTTPEKMESDS